MRCRGDRPHWALPPGGVRGRRIPFWRRAGWLAFWKSDFTRLTGVRRKTPFLRTWRRTPNRRPAGCSPRAMGAPHAVLRARSKSRSAFGSRCWRPRAPLFGRGGGRLDGVRKPYGTLAPGHPGRGRRGEHFSAVPRRVHKSGDRDGRVQGSDVENQICKDREYFQLRFHPVEEENQLLRTSVAPKNFR